MEVESEIRNLENEINVLKADISPLQIQHDSLLRQVTTFESSNNLRPLPRHNKARAGAGNNTNPDDPPLIVDSYFDDSLRAYFAPAKASSSRQKNTQAPQSESLASIQERAIQGSYALLESLHRFGGITAFPINDKLYDSSEDALLGLRFDVLSQSTGAFLAPHYIILRRSRSKDNLTHWLVFRYTTPAYISLDSFKHHLLASDEAQGLQKFVECVRDSLVATQYRHDTIHDISNLLRAEIGLEGDGEAKVFTAVDSDLQCRRVELKVSEKVAFELLLGASSVELVNTTLPNEASLHVTALLVNASIESLKSAFSQSLSYLSHQKLI